MNLGKCDRCGMDRDSCIACITLYEVITSTPVPFHNTRVKKQYPLCKRCWREWCDGGYVDIWWRFHADQNYELSNKFVLDFLGKLGQ